MSLWGKFKVKFFALFFILVSLARFNEESIKLFNKTSLFLFRFFHIRINSYKSKPCKAFMAMFMGFFVEDDSFYIGEQKQYSKAKILLTSASSTIRIRLSSNVHSRDLSILEYFIEVLGVGRYI